MARGPRCRLFIVLVALVLMAGCSSSGSADPARTNSPSSATDAQERSQPSGSWRRIAAAPVQPTGGMAAAWTGRLLVAWGGQASDGHEAAANGAAYDPTADRWDVLPPAPIAGRF